MTQAEQAMKRAIEIAERIAATKEGREAARLSDGVPELEAITRALFANQICRN
jgi:hypothetical protein